MLRSLNTEWKPSGQVYRDAKSDLIVAEAVPVGGRGEIRVSFFDDYGLQAEKFFRNSPHGHVVFPNWDAADAAVLFVNQL